MPLLEFSLTKKFWQEKVLFILKLWNRCSSEKVTNYRDSMTKLNFFFERDIQIQTHPRHVHTKTFCWAFFRCSMIIHWFNQSVCTHTLEILQPSHNNAPFHPWRTYCQISTKLGEAGSLYPGQYSITDDKCFLQHSLMQWTRIGLNTRKQDFLSKQLSMFISGFCTLSGSWAPEQLLTFIFENYAIAFTLLALWNYADSTIFACIVLLPGRYVIQMRVMPFETAACNLFPPETLTSYTLKLDLVSVWLEPPC